MSNDELTKVLREWSTAAHAGINPASLAEAILASRWGQRVQAQREALEWYYEDDKRQVDNGILEDVAKRPARAALGKET